MCGDHQEKQRESSKASTIGKRWNWVEEDTPPDWRNIELPPDHILKHLSDAHCHPTDTSIPYEEYDQVELGGICAMGTTPEDQSKVFELGSRRPWTMAKGGGSIERGPRVVSAFGYHPWFTHRYTLSDPPPSKAEHYRSIFFTKEPNTTQASILDSLLPYLPEPLVFSSLLEDLRANIKRSKADGRVTMLGEVGLDGGARMKWPLAARHLYEEKHPISEEEGEWNRLTPFKVSISHQRGIVEAQLSTAVELGVNVSFHSVAAPGPTMDVLKGMREKYGWRFTHAIKVDIHSAGGWSPQFWQQAEKQFPNLYASPSILITGRSQSAPDLIRAISPGRILVESDMNDVRSTTRLVWAATRWIAGCRGWKVESGEDEWAFVDEERDDEEEEGLSDSERWAVRTLERNWASFLKPIETTI